MLLSPEVTHKDGDKHAINRMLIQINEYGLDSIPCKSDPASRDLARGMQR